MISVYVSATSANVGVGYDCLGIGLDDYVKISFQKMSHKLKIQGIDPQYCNENNLVYRAFVETMKRLKLDVPGIMIKISSDVPFERGLGSSAICIVAGICGANALANSPLNKYEIFQIACELEGHPDNVAPAIFGGLCASFKHDNQFTIMKYNVHEALGFLAIIPDFPISTQAARASLPQSLSYAEISNQMGKCLCLCKAFEEYNIPVIKKANTDLMHEPFRKKLISSYESIKAICLTNKALTFMISGSGSTMLAIYDTACNTDAIIQQIRNDYPNYICKLLKPSQIGVRTEVE